MKVRVLILLLGCSLLVACGSAASPSLTSTSTARTTASPTPIPSPSPTPDLYAAAKAAYLAAAAKVNRSVDAENAALKAAKTPTQEQAVYRQIVADTTAFRLDLFAIRWPPDMKADANALVGAVSSDIGALQDAANSPNPFNSTTQAEISSANAADASAANVVRHDLGLPPTAP